MSSFPRKSPISPPHLLFFATLVPLLESFKHQGKLTLRHASAGGETFSADLGVRLRAVRLQAIVNFYGPTETSIAATGFDATAQIDRWRRRRQRGKGDLPIGFPCPGVSAYVVG